MSSITHPEHPTTSTEPPKHDSGIAAHRKFVSLRAILLGIVLMPINAFWLVKMEMATNQSANTGGTAGPYPTTFSLYANVICFIVALAALNGILRMRRSRWTLTQRELLLVYVMLAIGTCITSVDFLDVLLPMMGHPVHHASPSNRWEEIVIPYLPKWFYVSDKTAIDAWYSGNANPYELRYLRAWLAPAAAWSMFIFALFGAMLCMNLLVRKQWTRNEKLSYPIIQLPLEMTEENTGFFRQKLLWIGFAVAGSISILNGVSALMPSVPTIPVRIFDVSPFVVDKPWNAIGWTPVSFYPFAVGLGFLLPADMLFSAWFFYFVWKAERVISSAAGWSDYGMNYPYVNEQCFGGYFGIALIAVWGVRKHLAEIARAAWSFRKRDNQCNNAALIDEERKEILTNRLAMIGLTLCTIFVIGFFYMAGLALWICITAFVIYYAIAIAATRMRAELGPPAHDLHNGGPDYILTAALGARAFNTPQLCVLTYFYWFNRAYRSIAMPVQLEAFKIGERKNIGTGTLVAAILLATIVGTISGFWALYYFGYHLGTEARMAPHLNAFGSEAYNRLSGWLQVPRDTDMPAVFAVAFGLGLTIILQFLRMRFTGWPLHPIGLAVSGSYTMNTIWLPLMIAWVCKVTILRYGGLRSYRRALAFFYGLILGDYILGCLWPMIGWVLGVNAYSFQQ